MSPINSNGNSSKEASIDQVDTRQFKAPCPSRRLVTSSSSSAPGKVVKSEVVTFAPTAMVWRALHIDEFSDEEIYSTWYTRREYKIIRADVEATVQMMMCGGGIPPDNPWYCRRGLEAATSYGSKRKRRAKRDAMESVFKEQNLQWSQGVSNPQGIAEIYASCSLSSRLSAANMALQDEKDVHDGDYTLMPFSKSTVPRYQSVKIKRHTM